jgi:hypothetical protein
VGALVEHPLTEHGRDYVANAIVENTNSGEPRRECIARLWLETFRDQLTPPDEVFESVRRAGQSAGHSSATWAFNGNTTQETLRHAIQMLDEGDPALYDYWDAPALSVSVRYSDDETPLGIAIDAGWPGEDDDLSTAWEESAQEAFWFEFERSARAMLDDETEV